MDINITQNPQVSITKLSHDGRGMTHSDGKATFVFQGLPGEEVTIAYLNRRAKFDEAAVVEVLKPSLDRVSPQCRFFGSCGGCSLQHMEQAFQIDFKQGVLLEQLLHFGKVRPKALLTPLRAKPYGYRRKARYSVRYVPKKDKVLIGFRELHHPRFLAEIDSCQVLHPSLGMLIAPLQDALGKLENKKHIAQIEAAVGDNATALIFRHLEPLSDFDKNLLLAFAQQHELWVFLQPKGYDSIHKIYPCDQDNFLTYNVSDNVTLYFHPSDFTQINADINRQMIQQALTFLELNSDDEVLDLFCGIGNFSLPMAKQCKSVLGVEGEATMVKRAAMNADRNDIVNAHFTRADLNQPEALANALGTAPYNKILIDPPRSGARALVEGLPLANVEIIVYVSCSPASLARDAGILAERGFELSHVGVMDMFTHTEHVEAMAVFKRQIV